MQRGDILASFGPFQAYNNEGGQPGVGLLSAMDDLRLGPAGSASDIFNRHSAGMGGAQPQIIPAVRPTPGIQYRSAALP